MSVLWESRLYERHKLYLSSKVVERLGVKDGDYVQFVDSAGGILVRRKSDVKARIIDVVKAASER